MKENTMWDYPRLPKELNKETPLPEKLQADIPKRTGLIKVVRHKVNEILRMIK